MLESIIFRFVFCKVFEHGNMQNWQEYNAKVKHSQKTVISSHGNETSLTILNHSVIRFLGLLQKRAVPYSACIQLPPETQETVHVFSFFFLSNPKAVKFNTRILAGKISHNLQSHQIAIARHTRFSPVFAKIQKAVSLSCRN